MSRPKISSNSNLPLNIWWKFFNKISDKIWLSILSLVVIISRWWGKDNFLFDADSVRYALSLDHYDVSLHQPHPPGYALYVLIAKPIYWLTKDANMALIILAIMFSVLTLWTVFNLAKKICNRRVAWISVILLSSLPTFWFHGQVALNYVCDAFFSSWFALFIYEAIKTPKNTNTLIKASIILSIGAGFRPSLAMFMAPLWLWGLIRQRNSKQSMLNVGLVLGITFAWLLPATYLSGGIIKYWQTFVALFSGTIGESSSQFSWLSIKPRLWSMGGNLWFNFSWLFITPLLWILPWLIPGIDRPTINRLNLIFWWWWLVPALLFYTLVIFTLPGYLLVIVPAIVILLSQTLDEVIKFVSHAFASPKIIFNLSLTIMVLGLSINNVITYFYPQNRNVNETTHWAIEYNNKLWTALKSVFHNQFSPGSTVIGIEGEYVLWGIQHFQYYFPEYVAYQKLRTGYPNPDHMSFYKSFKRQIELTKTADILPTDKWLIIIQQTFSIPNMANDLIKWFPLPDNTGVLGFYDLKDSTTVTALRSAPYFNFLEEPAHE